MPEIIPAILEPTFDEIQNKLGSLIGLVSTVQIDVCDGKFVPSKTWPYSSDSKEWQKIKSEENGLPCWKDFDFEIDLMVERPELVISDWISAGAVRVYAHIEAPTDFSALQTVCDGKIELGLAINPSTSLEHLRPLIDKVAAVQCMGIERIGVQGEPFDERVIEKIKDLRETRPDLIISVDGGVSLQSA